MPLENPSETAGHVECEQSYLDEVDRHLSDLLAVER